MDIMIVFLFVAIFVASLSSIGWYRCKKNTEKLVKIHQDELEKEFFEGHRRGWESASNDAGNVMERFKEYFPTLLKN